MTTSAALLESFQIIATPGRIGFVALGVLIGLIIGVVPGTGGITGMALTFPFAMTMDPVAGIGMIIGILASSSISDTIPAVLFGIPGSNSSQATILDGHPMARRGEAAKALGAAFFSSLIGGVFAAVILTLSIGIARPLIMNFQSPELFMMAILGMSMLAILSGTRPLKALVSAGLGIMLSMIGLDSFTGTVRWTGGSLYLYDGLPITIVALGIFAVPEIMYMMVKDSSVSDPNMDTGGGFIEGMREALRERWLVIRTAVVGTIIGVIPGLGGSVTDWIAYAHARQTVPGASETFGKGDIRGVIGVDSATNAKDGGALLTTLLFGVPASAAMALLLGLFLVYRIEPGPSMVADNLPVTYAIVWTLLLAQIFGFIFACVMVHPLAKITLIPPNVFAPAILVIIAFAVFQNSYTAGDLVALLAVSLLGWVMKWYGYARPPLVLAFVLAPLLERWFFISFSVHGWAWTLRPIVVVVGLLTVLGVVSGLRTTVKGRRRALETEPAPSESATQRSEDR